MAIAGAALAQQQALPELGSGVRATNISLSCRG